MDAQAVLRDLDRERRTLDVPGFRRCATDSLVYHVRGDGKVAFVSFSAHGECEAPAAIADVVATLSGVSGSFEWKVFEHDQPTRLLELLAAAEFAIGPSEDLMVMPAHEAAALAPLPAAARIARVAGQAALDDYMSVARAVWGDIESLEWISAEIADEGSETVAYVAYDGDRPVASARASFPADSRFAGLFTGATLPEHRGRGFYGALVAERAREARARGFAYLMVDALPTSRPILERAGFVRLSSSRPCTWPRHAAADG